MGKIEAKLAGFEKTARTLGKLSIYQEKNRSISISILTILIYNEDLILTLQESMISSLYGHFQI